MMTFGTKIWLRLSNVLARRPVQFILLAVGVVILTASLSYSIATSGANRADIERIQEAFCAPLEYDTPQNRLQCRRLLDELLEDPSPEQARRLRRIVESAR